MNKAEYDCCNLQINFDRHSFSVSVALVSF